jgi:hypothetical protein
MLRTIPSSSAAYATDGIIPATAIGEASRAERMDSFARRRARALLADAEAEAARLREQALVDGYTQGCAEALAAFIPLALDLLRQEDALRNAALSRVREALRDTLGRLDVEGSLIASWCGLHVADADVVPVLHLPAGREDLERYLRGVPTLARLEIRTDEVDFPVLDTGTLVFQFDPERQLIRETRGVFDDSGLAAEIQGLSEEYARTLVSRLHAGKSAAAFFPSKRVQG